MSGVYTPMRGWGTGAGDGPPILHPTLSPKRPVVMISPCPYAHGDMEIVSETSGALSKSGLAYRFTADGTDPYGGVGVFTPRFLYDGTSAYTFTLSSSLPLDSQTYLSAAITLNPGGYAVTFQYNFSGGWLAGSGYTGGPTANITVPYYRWSVFQLALTMARLSSPMVTSSDWIQIALS